MRISTHQTIAMWWLVGSAWIFAPIAQAGASDAGPILGFGIALVTLMIASVSLLLRWPTFRKLFCWTDALSLAQCQALEQRNLRCYYQLAFEDGYLARVLPYFKRIIVVLIIAATFEYVVGKSADTAILKAIALFTSWYPMGIALVMVVSLPMARIMRRRTQPK